MVLDWLEYEKCARHTVAEGIVLLKNDGGVLPLSKDTKLSVFGRIQNHYYKSGTGSGGMVNVPHVATIPEALEAAGVTLNEELRTVYAEYEKEHPFVNGVGFGSEPWSQEEMELTEEVATAAAASSDVAIVIIGRTAGEEQDYANAPGAYRLSDKEVAMLRRVRNAFAKMVVVMNVSAVLDLEEMMEVNPDAILYAWQGGEQGAYGTVDVLLGIENPGGRLADTILKDLNRSPVTENFSDHEESIYAEDIYVGYRYFETFDKEAVRFPFGYGLSYTTFSTELLNAPVRKDIVTTMEVKVTNTGSAVGKEVVQVYVECPQGVLGKPARSLAAFAKTKDLAPGESETILLSVPDATIASYDDTGLTEYQSSYVLEAGTYTYYVGANCRDAVVAGTVEVSDTVLVEKLSMQMAPIQKFDRLYPVAVEGGYTTAWRSVVFPEYSDAKVAKEDCPSHKPYTGDTGIRLKDVREGKASMEDFVAQMTDEDLSAIIRGEGMGSPKVTPGTAAAFGGISPTLKELGVPCGCCSDGPSGMRLDCGTRAFSLPNGTLLACTWNPDQNEKLYSYLGMEMTKNHVDVLLGPGINIHRYALNGRNFEYFSEDPLITGKMAAAQIRGLHSAGVTGTLKHFCANNREHNRHGMDSVVSERALREIYLKGYEIAVKEGGADSVMTTYGAVNGTWTNGRHDLNTCILRNEWGFRGIVMTDWWANIGDRGALIRKNTFSRLVLAQNDFYAVCPDAQNNSTDDDTLRELEAGTITRGQLARMAGNICGLLMKLNTMKRMLGEPIDLEVLNYSEETEDFDPSKVIYYEVKDGSVIDLSEVDTTKGTSFVLGLDAVERGCYYLDMTASADASELSQFTVGVFFQSIPGGSFSFHGSDGKDVTIRRKILLSAKFGIMRLYFAQGGLKLKNMKFTFEKEYDPYLPWGGASYSDYIYG